MASSAAFKGYRLGSVSAPNVIEMYLCFVCPYSRKAFETLYNGGMEMFERKYPGQVQFLFRHQIQPWHSQSTFVHEAAIAVHHLDPLKFFEFVALLFKNQERFYDKPCWNKTRTEIYSELADIASQVGVSREGFLGELEYLQGTASTNAGNKVSDHMKLHLKISRQNAVHVSPTTLWNGLIDKQIESSMTVNDWEKYYLSKI